MNIQDIVSIESWSDIETRANYVKTILMSKNPNTNDYDVKLMRILGTYTLNPKVKCGISQCGQIHHSGYLVLLSNGSETNIGNTCGKNHFGTDFANSKKIINQVKTEKEYLERVKDFIERIDTIEKEIIEIQNPKGKANLAKIYNTLYFMTQNVEPLGEELTRRIRALIQANGKIFKTVRKSREEINMEEVAGGEDKRVNQYKDVLVGVVDGYEVLRKYDEITSVRDFFEFIIKETKGKNVYEITKDRRRLLAKRISDYEGKRRQLEELMELGNRLCKERNFDVIKEQLTEREANKVDRLWTMIK